MNHQQARKLKLWLLLALCAILALVCLVYPVYVIRPFRHQGARELIAALAVLRFRPAVVVLCAVGAWLAVVLYWRVQPSWWRRAVAVLGAMVVCLIGGLTRINIYELMFHPADRPALEPAAKTQLDGDEMVIAVDVAGSARAYPIRSISYHHVVNDVVGGVPIVATY